MSNNIQHEPIDVITYPCHNLLVKESPGIVPKFCHSNIQLSHQYFTPQTLTMYRLWVAHLARHHDHDTLTRVVLLAIYPIKVVRIPPHGNTTTVNLIPKVADDLETLGARTSSAICFTLFRRNYACWALQTTFYPTPGIPQEHDSTPRRLSSVYPRQATHVLFTKTKMDPSSPNANSIM